MKLYNIINVPNQTFDTYVIIDQVCLKCLCKAAAINWCNKKTSKCFAINKEESI